MFRRSKASYIYIYVCVCVCVCVIKTKSHDITPCYDVEYIQLLICVIKIPNAVIIWKADPVNI
jgi:hypothetical protein